MWTWLTQFSKCGRSRGKYPIGNLTIDIKYIFSFVRYNEMLFIVDTCQAASLYQRFYSPNVLAIGSSLVGEDSLSHHVDSAIGVYIIDRYTYYALEFLEHVTPTSNHTLGQFVSLAL